MRRFLPYDYARAANILIDSLGVKPEHDAGNGMAPFFYLPHVFYVAAHGLEHFELSMRAQYELTQRFTAEFSIRPYLIHHQQRTLKTLAAWSDDASVHVRRLVTEGTRPRLPWAIRLPAFQRDPRPVLALLERRLDNVIYRMGFGTSRAQSRQLVRHGHVNVNGRRVDIPSFVVKPGDVVSIRDNSKNNPTILHARDATAHAPAPNWLDVDRENLSAKVVNQPKREELVQIQLNEQLIVELYSK